MPHTQVLKASARQALQVCAALGKDEKVVIVGLAADSGCGKSTFMRRMTSVFGGSPKVGEP